MTPEQQKALALARARRRRQEAQGQGSPSHPAQEQSAPWYQQLGQAAQDVARLGSNAVTFGFRDKLAPYVTGRSVEEERAMTQEARDRAGSAGLATELMAGAAVPMGAASAGMTAMRAVPSTLQGVKGLAARTGAMAAEGSVYGAASALGNDQNVLEGMATGALGGAAGNLIGEGVTGVVSRVAGRGSPAPQTMNAEQLKEASRAAYSRADQAGVIVKPDGIQRLGKQIQDDLAEFGYHPRLQPRVGAVLDELNRLGEGNVTFKGLDQMRKIASAAGSSTDASERAIASKIIGRIDDYMGNLSADDVLTGNAQSASEAIREARQLWGRSKKLETANQLLDRAGLNAGSSGSGGNIENATRQQLKRILTNPKMTRGFTKDEQEAIRDVVLGTPSQNAVRLLGKLSPQGNGLMLTMGLGGAAMAPQFALPAMAVGAGAKKASERMTSRNVEELARLIASGGSRAALQSPKNATQLLAEQKREAIARALMGMITNQAVPAR